MKRVHGTFMQSVNRQVQCTVGNFKAVHDQGSETFSKSRSRFEIGRSTVKIVQLITNQFLMF
jgi:hypothetical protein